MPTIEGRVLDRVVEFDEKSRNFPVRALLGGAFATNPRSYTWGCLTYLDQGQEGACVGHGIAHEAAARPVVRPVKSSDAFQVYREAQKNDEYPGEAYSGTSTLAGMKAATGMGWYSEYRWAFGLEDVVLALGYKGPVVIGVNWYSQMFDTDSSGFIHVEGELRGGHCLLARGVKCVWLAGRTTKTFADLDLDASSILLHNSWGSDWGVKGTARISLRGMDRLLRESGDACVPVTRQ